MLLKELFIFILIFFPTIYLFGQNDLEISTDFPGGNIIVEKCDNKSTLYYQVTSDTIKLRPDLRDTKGYWFYWYFRVTGAANCNLFFQFAGHPIGSFGPAYSTNGGKNWNWLYDNIQENHSSFSFSFGENQDSVMFCMGIPYLHKNFDEFISGYRKNPYVSIHSLTKSEKGRDIEEIHICNPKITPQYKMIITARHHACEMIASYALEGIIESILNDNNEQMKWLRENVEFLIIPFVDKDGVEDGDQGKNRKPRDHNRDYSGESIYNSTAAIRKKVMDWNDGKLIAALDMHCPGINGKWHENIYFVGSKEKEIALQQKKFIDTLLVHQKGYLDLDPETTLLEYGTAWNVSNSFSKGFGFIKWISTIDDISLAISLELPYSNNAGQQVTTQNAKLFGKDIAGAISLYLKGL